MNFPKILKTCVLILAAVVAVAPLARAQFESRGSFVANNSPSCVGIGDFNHDGKLDLAVVAGGSNTNTIAIMLGNGDGTFQKALYYTAGVGAQFLTRCRLQSRRKSRLSCRVAKRLYQHPAG